MVTMIPLFILFLQITSLCGQFPPFPGIGDNTHQGSSREKTKESGKSNGNFGPPGFQFGNMMTGGKKFEFGGSFNAAPDWLKDLSFGKFAWDAINLFLTKGLFFTTNSEREKTPYAMDDSPSSSNITSKKSGQKSGKKGSFDMSMSSDGDSFESLITIFESVISDSPHRAHPFYLKRDAAGLDPYAVIGDILSVTVTSAILAAGKGGETGLFVKIFWYLVERILVHQIRILIGYQYGDGVMTAGTSLANQEAIKLAFAIKFPKLVKSGFQSFHHGKNPIGLPVILISEGNRETTKLFGMFTGISESFLVKVKMDKNGRMSAKDLELQIQKATETGKKPFMVIATLGSNTLGAVDPIADIVKITEKYDLWLHIDGTHGGPCLFSERIKESWKGVEKSNSFTFSFASLLGVPYPASFLITRNDGIFKSIWDMEKMYTFVATHIGPQFMSRGKDTDAGKTWFMWFIKGYRGLRQHVEYAYNLTKITRKNIKTRPNFEFLTSESDTPMVAFRVIPTSLKSSDQDRDSYVTEMDRFTEDLKLRLLFQGLIYISIARRLPHEPKHFMFPLSNSILTEPDIVYVLDTIDCHAKNIEAKKNAPCTDLMSKRINKQSSMATSSDGYAPYVNALMPDLHLPFFKGFFDIILKGGSGDNSGSDALDLGLTEFGMKQKDIMPYVKDFMEFWSLAFLGDSKGGKSKTVFEFPSGFKSMDKSSIVTLMTDYLTIFMSPNSGSQDSKEESSPFTTITNELEKYIRTKVGYTDGEGDGITVPADGSMVTHYAINVARYWKEIKTTDDSSTNKTLVMFISTEAHHSWKRGAASVGIGLDNCNYIPVDEATGQMNLTILREAIQNSLGGEFQPFLVVGTMGTDVIGAMDQFKEIADICSEYKLWFHIDGQFGGPLILSEKQKTRIRGIERSDSFSFSPSRFYLGESMKFGVLVTKQKDILQDMFTKDKNSTDEDGDDDGGSSSRPKTSDDFKFWLNLKSEGTKKTMKHIESILQNTQTCIKLMQSRKSFKLIMRTFELTSVSFVYKPKQYKEEDAEVLDGIQIQLETILKSKKITSVYYTNSSVFEHGKYGFLKIDVGNKDEEDLEALISKIEKYGQGIEVSGASKAKADRLVTSDENQYSSKSTTTTITHNTTSVTKTKGVSDTGSSEEVIVTKKKYTKKTVSTNENTDTESENADRNEGESNQDEQDTRVRRSSSDKNVLDKTLPDGSSEEKITTKKKFTKKTITKSTKQNTGTEKENGDGKEVEGDENDEQKGTMEDGSASDKTAPIGSSEELIITKKKYTKKTVTTSTTGNTDTKTANADSKDEEGAQDQQETKENGSPSDKNEMNSPDCSSEGKTMTRKTYTKKTVMTSTKGNTDTEKKNADRKEVESDEEQLGTKRQGSTSHKNKMNPPNGSSEEKTITRKKYTKKTETKTTKGNTGTKKKNFDSNEADADSKEKYPYSKKKNANSKKDNVHSKEEDGGDQKPVKNKGYGSPSANDQMFPSSIFFG